MRRVCRLESKPALRIWWHVPQIGFWLRSESIPLVNLNKRALWLTMCLLRKHFSKRRRIDIVRLFALSPFFGVAGVALDRRLDSICIITEALVVRNAIAVGLLLPFLMTMILSRAFPSLSQWCYDFQRCSDSFMDFTINYLLERSHRCHVASQVLQD